MCFISCLCYFKSILIFNVLKSIVEYSVLFVFYRPNTCLILFFSQKYVKGMSTQDMLNAKITTLFKNKGTRSDYNIYNEISFFGIAYKAIASVVLHSL